MSSSPGGEGLGTIPHERYGPKNHAGTRLWSPRSIWGLLVPTLQSRLHSSANIHASMLLAAFNAGPSDVVFLRLLRNGRQCVTHTRTMTHGPAYFASNPKRVPSKDHASAIMRENFSIAKTNYDRSGVFLLRLLSNFHFVCHRCKTVA